MLNSLVARTGIVMLIALACALTGPGAAMAADAEYADWTLSGQSGTEAVPATGFPEGDFTTNATGLQVPSGSSTFLNEATPFGAEFGSSRGHGYLKFGTASGGRPSTTTLTFDSPTPAGEWGFALGDIDADHVKITATGAGGAALTAAQLGWEDAFNYCADSPRPGSCRRGVYTDMPSWNAATSTLVGHVLDTDGAAGWFMPTRSIKKLTLVFSVQSGIPVGQLWIAAKWPKGKPDIAITKHADPQTVLPGHEVKYTVKVTNNGTAPEAHAEFTDDLGDVVDDARYNDDAHADAGTITYTKPKLTWKGPVDPGQTRTITYSVKVDDPPKGNRKILNAIIGDGPRMTCQGGKGPGCAVAVKVRKHHKRQQKKHHKNVCRYAVPPTAPSRFCRGF